MDMNLSSSDSDRHCNDPDEYADQSVDLISFGFNTQLDLKSNDDDDDEDHKDSKEKEEEYHDDDDDDFTFMLVGHDDDDQIYDDKLFEDGQIRPVFPLFDQNLLLDGEYDIEEIDHLPILPPVDKIFIESPRGFPSSTAPEHEQNGDTATGPYCAWSKETATATATAELSKKSNSTGFSKLWRLREKVDRSNSDGRDAFVFLKSSDRSTAATPSSSSSKPVTSDGTFVKVNVAGGKARVVKRGTKGNKSTVSAFEAYLRSGGGHTEEERRRSYLPYRPELMGFFTNVHGGLSKNVHPY
ncbi:hypothetical protein SSX86_020957 [Deinandra increscens subsp. villosa]|uniref:Uncharacterized protein n=1 Tax=Deinandra increscens subsp. villosa TaxID=3103831 RepID=A0AAP0GR98_9ASTR